MNERTYFCIDMKSFYASAECAERGLDPMTTNLVVADEARGRGAICLAVSAAMKAKGVRNRCRLFEIPKDMDYIIAKPRMKKYIEYAADIYEIYLDYLSPNDIHVYSIDESFLDVTAYLKIYRTDAKNFAKRLIREIFDKRRIPATAGIGTNMYLAKIALDITAKKSPDRIGFLNEELYKQTLWHHLPLTDFWQVSDGTVRRLRTRKLYTMYDVAHAPEEVIYELFGINAELLIDHSKGLEPCIMEDIKKYKGKSHSVSSSQILFENYTFEQAEIVVKEMILNGCQELLRRHVVTEHVGVFVGYADDKIAPTGKVVRMTENTSAYSVIVEYALEAFRKSTHKNKLIRRLSVEFSDVVSEEMESYGLFTDVEKVEREKRTEETVLHIKDKFGKNAMLRGIDMLEKATARERNKLIGGHNGDEE